MTPLLLASFALVSTGVASFARASPVHALGDTRDLAQGGIVYTTGALVNLRSGLAVDAPVLGRLPTGTRVRVIEQVSDRVEVSVGSESACDGGCQRGWISRALLSTMGMTADLDADGEPERIVVVQDASGRSVAWLREGEHVQHVIFYEDPEPYLGTWEVVPADQAGVPLLRVGLGQNACGGFPTTWLSYQDGQLRQALQVLEWADGMYGESFDVTFAAPGQARIHSSQRADESDEVVVRDRVCALQVGVFRCL